MHPELLNNTTFLRYYQQWQQDPSSIVFASIAEFFLRYGLVAEAIQICQTGLEGHPECVTGRLVLAKAFRQQKEWKRAEAELGIILKQLPGQAAALKLLVEVEAEQSDAVAQPAVSEPTAPLGWQTLTMANIYAAQGHFEQAKEIVRAILQRDPHHAEAKAKLAQLESEV